MSFELKGPNMKPMIQEAQSMLNNGGGGNTGYFQRGKKKNEDKEKLDLFGADDDADCYIPTKNEDTEIESDVNSDDNFVPSSEKDPEADSYSAKNFFNKKINNFFNKE